MLMTIIAVITLIVCISLAAAKLAVFWAVLGIIGSGISIVIYAIQAVCEWQEAKHYEPMEK